jgi:hypothetical protein
MPKSVPDDGLQRVHDIVLRYSAGIAQLDQELSHSINRRTLIRRLQMLACGIISGRSAAPHHQRPNIAVFGLTIADLQPQPVEDESGRFFRKLLPFAPYATGGNQRYDNYAFLNAARRIPRVDLARQWHA